MRKITILTCIALIFISVGFISCNDDQAEYDALYRITKEREPPVNFPESPPTLEPECGEDEILIKGKCVKITNKLP